MKTSLLLAVASLILITTSCTEKTATNSIYSGEISELDKAFNLVDSNYNILLNLNVDTLINLRDEANAKYQRVKEVYKSEVLDTNFEKIMLIARGQFGKKLGKIGIKRDQIEKEFAYSTKQYNTLKENLIHETLEENKALTFFNEEKQALIILNAEIVTFNEDLSNTVSLSSVIIPQMDSIINVHENKE